MKKIILALSLISLPCFGQVFNPPQVTAGSVQSALAGASGCGTAGSVYSPSSGSCVAGGGAATFTPSGIQFATTSAAARLAVPADSVFMADSQTNMWANTTISSTTTNWTRGTFFGVGAGAVWGTPGSTGITGQEGLTAFGYHACFACKTNNGSVAIGDHAMENDPGGGNTTPGEDQNMVAIGPFALQNDDGTSFEPIAIGNKACQNSTGLNSTLCIGTHIFGPKETSGQGGNIYLGGNLSNAFGAVSSFIGSNHGTFLGADIFNPGTAPTASTTYSTAFETIVGALSGTCFYNVQGNTLVGAQIANKANCSTLPTGIENVFIAPGYYGGGNSFLQNFTSGTANYVLSGQGFGGAALVGGNISSGAGNVIVGGGAGNSTLAVNQMTLVGNEAGMSTTSAGVVAVGSNAFQNLTGSFGVAAGFTACQNATSAVALTCLGYQSGLNETTGGSSVFSGYQAYKRPNPSNGGHVAIGTGAGLVASGTTGNESEDTMVGHSSNSFGNFDTALGSGAIVGVQGTPINGAVQIGSGSNLTANTMQYQANKFLDNANNHYINHIIGTGTAPTLAAGAGAGTSPTISLDANAHDSSGTINITTGTLPTASATVATLTFGSAYGTAPHCTISANNALTAVVSTTAFNTETTTTLVIGVGTVALTAATAYSWDYTCIQ